MASSKDTWYYGEWKQPTVSSYSGSRYRAATYFTEVTNSDTTYKIKVYAAGSFYQYSGYSASELWIYSNWNSATQDYNTKDRVANGNSIYPAAGSDYSYSGLSTSTWYKEYTITKTTSTQTKWYKTDFYASGPWSGCTLEVSVPAKTSYVVSYNKNSTYNSYADSTVSNVPNNDTKWYDDTLTLSSGIPTKANTTANGPTVTLNYNYSGSTNSTLTPTDTYSYSFSKWNTSSNGNGTNYNPGGSYTSNSAATLYAIWTRSKSAGSVTLPTPTRAGFTFLGWATTASAASGEYNGGSSYTPNSAIILYAIWRANLGDAYVLKATSRSDTWESLINNQGTSGSTLYEAGGQYNGWSTDNSGYVTCFGKRIETGNGAVQKTDKPIRGETYYYYE